MYKYSLIDVLEEDILEISRELLELLLKDKTTKKNIIWGTSDYESLGHGFSMQDQILIPLITGEYSKLIQPRITKEKTHQTIRTKKKAEVFTPSWICNEQNNLVDEQWFCRSNIFNSTLENGWKVNSKKIEFPDGKNWKMYVDSKRLEIACGEAPYLVSRYDTVTGKKIDVNRRIGILDRKMRVINENVNNREEWFKWVVRAFQSIYAYEYQGDNLLLARENILYSFVDYSIQKFNKKPLLIELLELAKIISWNIWQMDGITGMTPIGKPKDVFDGYDMFNENHEIVDCQICKIRDWRVKKSFSYKSLLGVK